MLSFWILIQTLFLVPFFVLGLPAVSHHKGLVTEIQTDINVYPKPVPDNLINASGLENTTTSSLLHDRNPKVFIGYSGTSPANAQSYQQGHFVLSGVQSATGNTNSPPGIFLTDDIVA